MSNSGYRSSITVSPPRLQVLCKFFVNRFGHAQLKSLIRWSPVAIAHMENTEMNFARFPHLRTVKFAPAAVFFLFLITNLTGFYFSPAFAPTVDAKSAPASEFIPLDI